MTTESDSGDTRLCRCAHIMLNNKQTESRNWHPDCPIHGTESVWWNSYEQQAQRELDSIRLRDLQARANEARKKARP